MEFKGYEVELDYNVGLLMILIWTREEKSWQYEKEVARGRGENHEKTSSIKQVHQKFLRKWSFSLYTGFI